MAVVIRSPDAPTGEDPEMLDQWHVPTFAVESYGCGTPDDASGQGIQPYIYSGE